MMISGLNSTARMPPVYASPRRSPARGATLGPGWWSALPVRTLTSGLHWSFDVYVIFTSSRLLLAH